MILMEFRSTVNRVKRTGHDNLSLKGLLRVKQVFKYEILIFDRPSIIGAWEK